MSSELEASAASDDAIIIGSMETVLRSYGIQVADEKRMDMPIETGRRFAKKLNQIGF
jgi:hypothetical protein